MIESKYIEMYTKCAWLMLEGNITSEKSTAYSIYLGDLINTCQFPIQNLTISLYFLHKYSKNNVNTSDNESNMTIYLVLTSLILANKTFDDQSYTLKTWSNICNGISKSTKCRAAIHIDFKLLKDLEMHFLSCLNYSLSYLKIDMDQPFWAQASLFGSHWLQVIKSSICAHTTTTVEAPEIAIPIFTHKTHLSISSVASTPIRYSTSIASSFMTPCTISMSISGASTPASNVVVSPLANFHHINRTPVNYASPLTPLTPASSDMMPYKRRKYTYSNVQAQAQAQQAPFSCIPTSALNPMVPYAAQFNFQYQIPQQHY